MGTDDSIKLELVDSRAVHGDFEEQFRCNSGSLNASLVSSNAGSSGLNNAVHVAANPQESLSGGCQRTGGRFECVVEVLKLA